MPASDNGDVVLGIDFGTTYTAAAALVNGRLEMVMDRGDAAIPSAVYLPQRGDPVVGRAALQRLAVEPAQVVRSIKRILGRELDDSQVRIHSAGIPYRIKAGPSGSLILEEVGPHTVACEQVASYILAHVRRLAEARFGPRVFRAVVGIPVRFAPGYPDAVRRAGKIAGIEVLELVPEPVAGARALGLKDGEGPQIVSVVDFGGGTLDVSLLRHADGKLTPLAAGGDDSLGGDDFDEKLAEGIAGAVFHKSRYDMHRDGERWQRLVQRAEQVKCSLSFREEAMFRLRDAYSYQGRRHDIETLVDRVWAEGRWAQLLDRAAAVAERVTAPVRGNVADKHVFLLGGTSMMPAVQRVMRERLGMKVTCHERSDLAVVAGLAMYASRYSRADRMDAAVYR